MDDKATAARIVADHMNSVCETSMEAAIVAALEAARRSLTDAARGGIIDCRASWARRNLEELKEACK